MGPHQSNGVILFAEPQVFTVNAVAKSLNRTGTVADGAKYASATRDRRLEINHQYGRRVRRQFKLTTDTLVANPLISGQQVNQSMSVYIVVDHPVGYDVATAKYEIDAFLANLSASSGANVTKLLGGES